MGNIGSEQALASPHRSCQRLSLISGADTDFPFISSMENWKERETVSGTEKDMNAWKQLSTICPATTGRGSCGVDTWYHFLVYFALIKSCNLRKPVSSSFSFSLIRRDIHKWAIIQRAESTWSNWLLLSKRPASCDPEPMEGSGKL